MTTAVNNNNTRPTLFNYCTTYTGLAASKILLRAANPEPSRRIKMIRTIYAVRDTLAETLIGGVHLFITDAQAIRFFGDIAGDKQTSIARHPLDHELIKLAELDEQTGTVVGFVSPHVVITGAQWLAAQTPSTPQLALEA